jgi:hypothetical protein
VLDTDGAEHLRYTAGDPGFAMFLLVADAAAGRRLGVSRIYLPDARWRDFYDDGLTPIVSGVRLMRSAHPCR